MQISRNMNKTSSPESCFCFLKRSVLKEFLSFYISDLCFLYCFLNWLVYCFVFCYAFVFSRLQIMTRHEFCVVVSGNSAGTVSNNTIKFLLFTFHVASPVPSLHWILVPSVYAVRVCDPSHVQLIQFSADTYWEIFTLQFGTVFEINRTNYIYLKLYSTWSFVFFCTYLNVISFFSHFLFRAQFCVFSTSTITNYFTWTNLIRQIGTPIIVFDKNPHTYNANIILNPTSNLPFDVLTSVFSPSHLSPCNNREDFTWVQIL